MNSADLEIRDFLACPECRAGLSELSGEKSRCSGCGRMFQRDGGIWEMLPLPGNGLYEDALEQREYYEGPAADSIDSKRRRFGPLHYNKVRGIIDQAVSLAAGGGRLKVCEIGAGTALHASWFMEEVPVEGFFGVDVSRRALQNGRSRWEMHPEFVPVQGSAYRLPMKDGIFDLVFFSGTLHHCHHPAQAVAEAARILRKGGILIISEPVWYFPLNLFLNLRIPEESGQRLLKRKNVEQWCSHAGLELRDFEYFNYLPRPGSLDKPVKGLESIISRIPLVRRLSSMFRCTALKRDTGS